MRYPIRALRFLLLLMAVVYSYSGWAESCSSQLSSLTTNIPGSVKYLPTLPVNTQMTNMLATTGQNITFNCDLQAPVATAKRVVYKQLNTKGSPLVINGQHVFSTELDGLGYSLGFQCSGGAIRYIDGSDSPEGSESTTVCDSTQLSSLMTQKSVDVKVYITFYKTGDVALVSGNHASVGQLAQVGELLFETQQNGGAGFTSSSPVTFDLPALNIEIGSSGSCLVKESNIHVNLGTVNKAEFKGKNTAAGASQSFDIPIYCTTPTDVRIGFFGVTADPSITDALALTQQSGAASGVGVRLSYGNNDGAAVAAGTVVKLNESSNLPVLRHITASSAGQAENINFSAQYVQTGDSVSAGIADSMATFAIEYN